MRKQFIIAVLFIAVAWPAHAQSWRASVVLVPERSAATCGQADLTKLFWDLKVDGTAFTGVSTAGGKFTLPIAPDGTVKGGYTGSFAGRSLMMELTANTKTRQVETYNTQANCRYKLVPVQ